MAAMLRFLNGGGYDLLGVGGGWKRFDKDERRLVLSPEIEVLPQRGRHKDERQDPPKCAADES